MAIEGTVTGIATTKGFNTGAIFPTLTTDATGLMPYCAVTFSPGNFFEPATATTDSYTYGTTNNRLMSMDGTTRSFTHDAAGNVTYDARTGVGYGYSYNAAGRLEAFSIDGIRQANAPPERFPILFIAGRAHLERDRPTSLCDGRRRNGVSVALPPSFRPEVCSAIEALH